MKRQSQASKEYIEVPVISRTDPTGDVVQMAFPTDDNPTTWYNGSWDPAGAVDKMPGQGSVYLARCLVGPGGGVVTLTAQAAPYNVYVKITDAPEVPVLKAGQVLIY